MNDFLIALPSGIGDAIQSLVSLFIIDSYYKDATKIALVEPNLINLLSKQFSKIKFVSNRSSAFFEQKQKHDVLIDFNGLPWLRAKLHLHKFNTIITHTCFIDSAIMDGADCIYVNGTAVKNSIFFDANGYEPKPAWTLYAKMAMFIKPEDDVVELPFTTQPYLTNKKLRKRRSNRSGRSVIGIFPGGASKDKHWPISKYLALIESLIRSGFEVRVFLGKKELRYMKHFAQKGCFLVVNKRIDKLIKLHADLDFAISNDTGLMHIIGSLGIGLLGVFLDTTPQSWFTYNGNNQGYITQEYSDRRRYQSSSSVFDVLRYAKFLSQRSITLRSRNEQFKKLGRNITIRS